MANAEHLAVLRQGVKEWNAWRTQHEEITPDLMQANLYEADLSGADLFWADLNRAKLIGANFLGANLLRANFLGADLSEASLYEADLSEADLFGANLLRADLGRAKLIGANLNRAVFTEAILWETIFGDTTLTSVRGLETCRHRGPSTLDHRTLAKSGPLPLAFLRGCGLPDALIDYLPSLLNEPLQYYSCFISYSSHDLAFADRLHADLQNNGVRCWFAPHDIQGGKKTHEQLDQAIRIYDKLLLVLSPASIQSGWVEFEIRRARKREVTDKRRVLFPLGLVDYDTLRTWECFDADTAKDLATEIREYYIPDFTQWKDHDAYQLAFARLLRDLKAHEQ